MVRIEFQPAYVLHTRSYRDTSLLVDFFTPDYGRVGAVARGARRRKGGKRSLLNPFTPLLISLQGKTDLKLLTGVEADRTVSPLNSSVAPLSGIQVYGGFYLNELIVRLLLEQDPHPELYLAYQQSLQSLRGGLSLEPVLRNFELTLFEELGYAINFDSEAYSDIPLLPEKFYRYEISSGFVSISNRPERTAEVFCGADLKAIAQRDFTAPEVLRAAKHLARIVLRPLLGSRPLHSRELFAGKRNH